MDKWLTAASALGGLAAIGGLLDLAMYKAEKDRLKARLEDWWLRFTDVKWSNFGRREAELAVGILDRWAGPLLWSWKRWRFAARVSLAVALLTSIWVTLRALWSGIDLDFTRGMDSAASLLALILFVSSIFVAFALSLSVTRYVAVLVARVATTPIRSVLSFAVLLGVHILLLVYWSVIVYGLQAALVLVLMYALTRAGLADFSFFFGSDLAQAIVSLFTSLFWPEADREGLKLVPATWSSLFSLSHPGRGVGNIWVFAFKVAMDLVANGLRIVFALAFLSSFVFRPLIQEPIGRLWYGVMASDKPMFTVLFGAIGAIVGALKILAG